MYKHLFGPVPSRRLGISLGVDLVPHKVCSLDCVYCEVGKTTRLTTERKEYVKYDNVVKELSHFFENNPDPEYITFSGAGEPTLNSRIGDVLGFIKDQKPDIPVAVLTNGTLLNEKKVRDHLRMADLVLPSLDAASEIIFQKINRPAPDLNVHNYIQGLIDFRKEFSGKIWLEVFILPGYNDNEDSLQHLKEVIDRINPDSVQLNTLDRPGTISDLKALPIHTIKEIAESWDLNNVEIIASGPKRKEVPSYKNNVETIIYETISRRPCTLDDLTIMTGLHVNEINKYLEVLEKEKKIEAKIQNRGIFYQSRIT